MRYWQLCPKCNGSGNMWMTYFSAPIACDVCNGKKIIATPDCNFWPFIPQPYIPSNSTLSLVPNTIITWNEATLEGWNYETHLSEDGTSWTYTLKVRGK